MKPSISLTFEQESISQGRTWIFGVDEVGRGCLAGPVVAAAVAFDWSNLGAILELQKNFPIRDSKTLNRKQRKETSHAIRHMAMTISVAEVDAQTIDEVNILQATLRAMKSAVSDALSANGINQDDIFAFVDGNQTIPNVSWMQQAVIKGDGNVFSIAAASIVAKEHRDSLMEKFNDEFPGYDFAAHKGYGTKKHQEAIRSLGLTSIHRKTFWHE